MRASRRRGRGEDAIRGGERARAVRGEGRAARRRIGRRRGICGPVGGPVARGARGGVGGVPIAVQQEHLRAQKVRLGQERVVVAARANERVEGGQRRAHATGTELGDGAVVPVVTRWGFGGRRRRRRRRRQQDERGQHETERHSAPSRSSRRHLDPRARTEARYAIPVRLRDERHRDACPTVRRARSSREGRPRYWRAAETHTPRFQSARLSSARRASERDYTRRAHESNLRISTRRV